MYGFYWMMFHCAIKRKSRKQFVSICKELMVCWKHRDTTNKDTTNINHQNLDCRKTFGLKVWGLMFTPWPKIPQISIFFCRRAQCKWDDSQWLYLYQWANHQFLDLQKSHRPSKRSIKQIAGWWLGTMELSVSVQLGMSSSQLTNSLHHFSEGF